MRKELKAVLVFVFLAAVAVLWGAAPPSGNFVWHNFFTTNQNPRIIGTGGINVSSNAVAGTYTIDGAGVSGGGSQVWTNDGQIIHPVSQPTNGISITASNGGIMLGSNTHAFWGTYALKEALVSYHDATAGDVDYNELYIGASSNGVTSSFDIYMDHTFAVFQLQSGTTGTIFNAEDAYVYYYGPDDAKFLPAQGLRLNSNRTKLYPQAPNDGTVPYLFDTSLAHTSGNLLEVKNHGSTQFSVDYGGGASFGSSGLYFISKDGDSDLATLLVLEFIADPALAFWHIESADGSAGFGGYNLRIGADGNLDAIKNVAYVWPSANANGFLYNDSFGSLSWSALPLTNTVNDGIGSGQIPLTNGVASQRAKFKSVSVNPSGGGSVTDQGTNVQFNIPSTNGFVDANFATNKVRVAPGAGTAITTNYENGGVTYVVSDSEVASTMVKTNFVLNQVYTNTSVQPVLIKADTFMITAAVSGDCAVDLMYSAVGATDYALLSRVAIATTVAGGLALPITNTIVGVVTNLGSYYFTNTSSGIGNTAGLVGAGTGQYVIIGGGAQGPTGAAGASGSSGVTWATNAIGATVGGASNEVFLVDTNLTINATNTATAGGTNTIKFSTAQPITTTASPTFSNLTVSGSITAPNILSNIQFGITIDGAGAPISTGNKGYARVPNTMTLTGWDIVADVSGSIVIDCYKTNYANFPPTLTFAGSEKPTLSSAQKNQDTSLSSMVTALTKGDYIGYNVDSATTVTRVTLTLYGTIP